MSTSTKVESTISMKFKPMKKNGKFIKLSLNEKIRQMFQAGHASKDIAKHLGTRYQRVRNVIAAHSEKIEREDAKAQEEQAASEIEVVEAETPEAVTA